MGTLDISQQAMWICGCPSSQLPFKNRDILINLSVSTLNLPVHLHLPMPMHIALQQSRSALLLKA